MAKKKVKSKAKQPPKSSIPENITSKVLAETYSTPSPPVFMKVCRLCESKDGPFLNIFDADKVTAKKIEELMPFGIAENDDLPHKICFRCSAKLEELYEFIQKCIKTQENLRTELGKTGPFITKAKTVKVWEEKLNKNNMSNDDICDALIKKAMEGIKNLPASSSVEEASAPSVKRITRRTETAAVKTETVSDNEDGNISLKDVKSEMLKNRDKVPASKPGKTVSNNVEPIMAGSVKNSQKEETQPANKSKNNALVNNFSFDYVEDKPQSDNVQKKSNKPAEKPFNIMDYISMIKVNGVGVLFQCKLCNRNFLKKEVVESHLCAKNGVPKVETPKTVPVQEAPKGPTVKYITLDNTAKKSQSWKYNENSNGSSTDSEKSSGEEKQQEQKVQSAPTVKPKPRAGPASKTRRVENDNAHPGPSHNSDTQQPQTNVQSPSVHIPSAPNLNGRFKLVPGPNNMFTLVEDTTAPVVENHKSKKRKAETESEIRTKEHKRDHKSNSPDVTNVEEKSTPYPVGLFQTVAHSAQMYQQPMATPTTAFTTPAMKKQSYTIVQTGNPSKLLISTKALAPPIEAPKKRVKKSKPEVREDDEPKEPFKVTLEDVAPPKDAGFFTFINVDPLLQPSYVLPTDNIIQESQISTSSAVQNASENVRDSKDKDKYSCNMCGDSFTREKKLLAHIQSHYSKMDEEDQLRAEKGPKKKGRK